MKCEVCGKEIEQSSYSHATLCSTECFNDHYWMQRVNRKDVPTQVVADGCVYQIGDENSNSSFRGYDGRKFVIEFFDGRKVTTTNLWSNGKIPERFRALLPDNAKFII